MNHGNKIVSILTFGWVKEYVGGVIKKTIDVQMIDVYEFAYLNS